MNSTVIFIPCYNESKRLKIDDIRHYIENCNLSIDFYFIDDGSTDNTTNLISSNLLDYDNVHLIILPRNLGKGNALRQGVIQMINLPYYYYGFIDADMDIPFMQLNNILNVLERNSGSIGITIRNLKGKLDFGNLRSLLSVIMVYIANRIIGLKPGISDTQCGCKIFKKDFAEVIFKDEFISNWLFDIEIFLRLKRIPTFSRNSIFEIPISRLNSSKDSNFNIFRNFIILKQLYLINKFYN